LHLINFDPLSVFASENAIIEYNWLKQIHNFQIQSRRLDTREQIQDNL